jgi:hypothetical protein
MYVQPVFLLDLIAKLDPSKAKGVSVTLIQLKTRQFAQNDCI